MPWKQIIVEIADLLIIEKGVDTQDLIQNNFQMPAERIIKFMKNIKV